MILLMAAAEPSEHNEVNKMRDGEDSRLDVESVVHVCLFRWDVYIAIGFSVGLLIC